jgi:sigma-B regulation protein RsbU (phosphoserine phosphatase)
MPKKSVREMNTVERLRYSLGARTLGGIILMAVLLGAAAITFGFILYKDSVSREYRSEAWNLSKTVVTVMDEDLVRDKTEKTLALYEEYSPEVKDDDFTHYYAEKFRSLKDSDFNAAFSELVMLEGRNKAEQIFIAAIDKQENRIIYIIDTDDAQGVGSMGTWIQVDPETVDMFTKGAPANYMDKLKGNSDPMPSVIEDIPGYGYYCVASSEFYHNDRYHVMAFSSYNMNKIAEASKRFLIQYILMVLAITVLFGIILGRKINKDIVKPVNRIAEAAGSYIDDKNKGVRTGMHFQQLEMNTGDEFENLAFILKDMESDMADYMNNLTRVTVEKEKINTELSVASQIQEGMIPRIFPAFPDRKEFDLYASMDTAKEVGGDFYDFFLIDDDHLAMVMADVSGKGIPAALFMMGSKIMINNYALTLGPHPGKILSEVNNQLCIHNPAGMFVTVWLGILEISTGQMTAASAGHEYPILKRANGNYGLLMDKHDFVLGGFPGIEYGEYELDFKHGDALFQYTDGVTEAMDKNNEMYGAERVLEILNDNHDSTSEEILMRVSEGVKEFVGNAPQFDDITMLAFRYFGPEGEKREDPDADWDDLPVNRTLTVLAVENNLAEVNEFIKSVLDEVGCSPKARMAIDLAVEEEFVNISHYAYAPETGKVTVKINASRDPKVATLTFMDEGEPYDPFSREDPDVTLSAKERSIGGLGVYLIKELMDETSYKYENGRNVITMVKTLEDEQKEEADK